MNADEPEVEGTREWLRARARFLVGGLFGRSKDDPAYAGYCEGRDGPGPKERQRYSSCGDLAQGLAFEAGCSLPFINRAALDGWRPGRNLLDFYDASSKARHPALKVWNSANGAPALLADEVPGAGDICFVWSDAGRDAHTFVAGNVVTGAKGEPLLETFNFGAGGMSPAAFPGARQSNAPLRECWQVTLASGTVGQVYLPHGSPRALQRGEKTHKLMRGLWIGGRRLRYVLDVPRLIELCDPDAMPSMTGGEIDELEAASNLYEQR